MSEWIHHSPPATSTPTSAAPVATPCSVWVVRPTVRQEVGPSLGGRPVRIGLYPTEADARGVMGVQTEPGHYSVIRGSQFIGEAVIAQKTIFAGHRLKRAADKPA